MSVTKEELILLPNGKPHVSYSEISEWKSCQWKHHLKKIKGLGTNESSIPLEFGTAVHAALESYLRTGELDVEITEDLLVAAWNRNRDLPTFTLKTLLESFAAAATILSEVPDFMNRSFPGWEPIAAEEQLYEPIEDEPGHRFKGFIDCIISVPGKKKGTRDFVIIDWKTSNAGWYGEARRDQMKNNQLVLYKHFWCKKYGIPLSSVKCAFIILKKTGKGPHCDKLVVSVGPKTVDRALPLLGGIINSMKAGRPRKNRESCRWCEFKGTIYCP